MVTPLTCDIEVCIACGLPYFVGNDAFIDASMSVADGSEHQAMHILICRNGCKSPSVWCKLPSWAVLRPGEGGSSQGESNG